MHYAALIASITFNGTSLVLLKAFALERERRAAADSMPGAATTTIGGRLRIMIHPLVLGSMACFAAAAVTWMIALAGIDLSVAYPSMSIIYVATALVGRFLFGEHIPPRRWAGISLVVAGVALMYAG
jgi:drug/metabolite transporter (DMT)-like permease